MAIDDVINDGLGGISHNVITVDSKTYELVSLPLIMASNLRTCVLRNRNDGIRRCALRHCPVWHGSLPRLTPGDHNDRAGRVSQKMAPVLRQVYDQMMEPSGSSRWVYVHRVDDV